ncbi:MAG: dUTP diphosphatase [Dethiobacteria bacterium]
MRKIPEKVDILVTKLSHAEDLPLPGYATKHSAGIDLFAAVEGRTLLNPGEIKLIPTGLALAIPPGYEGQVRPRSGLAIKHGVTVLNSPGTIDADYRGEIKVILINLGDNPYFIQRGERIAQLVIQALVRIEWQEVEELPLSGRDAGGFGHTGRF